MNGNLLSRLGIAYPIFQAPMAGGTSTPALAAAVSNAGGLGWLGSAYDPPEKMRAEIRAVRALTGKPFGLNLFIPQPPLSAQPVATEPMLRVLNAYYTELGLPPVKLPPVPSFSFKDQLAVVREERVPIFSFTMGLLDASEVAALKAQSAFIIGTACTVEEARQVEKSGADAVILQGAEAGAHRGGFTPAADSMVGLFALIPRARAAVRIPLIAAGGIMDGRGVAAALSLGAEAVQMGTAFLLAHESGAVESYKTAVLAAEPEDTKVTTVFSGREARGIVNRFMREVEKAGVPIPPFPIQNELTRPLRRHAAQANLADFLSLWSGQNGRAGRRMGAAELVAKLVAEWHAADPVGR